MSLREAFGSATQVSVNEKSHKKMKQLVTLGKFKDLGHVWQLGAALGISKNGKTEIKGKKDNRRGNTLQSLDPDRIFAAIMLAKHEENTPEERVNLLVEYAEWGINDIFRRHENGTLNFTELAEVSESK